MSITTVPTQKFICTLPVERIDWNKADPAVVRAWQNKQLSDCAFVKLAQTRGWVLTGATHPDTGQPLPPSDPRFDPTAPPSWQAEVAAFMNVVTNEIITRNMIGVLGGLLDQNAARLGLSSSQVAALKNALNSGDLARFLMDLVNPLSGKNPQNINRGDVCEALRKLGVPIEACGSQPSVPTGDSTFDWLTKLIENPFAPTLPPSGILGEDVCKLLKDKDIARIALLARQVFGVTGRVDLNGKASLPLEEFLGELQAGRIEIHCPDDPCPIGWTGREFTALGMSFILCMSPGFIGKYKLGPTIPGTDIPLTRELIGIAAFVILLLILVMLKR